MAPKRAAVSTSSEEDDSSDAETMDSEQPQNAAVAKKPQSDDDEEEDPEEDDEDEEDDEEEEEDEEETKKQPNAQLAPNPESDPDSSSDTAPHSPTASDFTIKPIVSKSLPGPTKKPAATSKRCPEPDSTPKKRRKTSGSNAEEEDTKKGRLWGEDGEVSILQGMIDFKAKKGADPSSNMTEFHEFLRGRLKADVSKSQLSDKVRRLKKKYYHGDEEAAAPPPVFAKGHEMKLAELSKRVWGVEACKNNGVNGVGNSSSKKSRKSGGATAKEEEEDDDSVYPVLALPVSYLPAEKSAVLEKKSKKKVLANGDTNVNVNVVENGGDAADEDVGGKGFWSRYPSLRDSVAPGKKGGMEDHFRQMLPTIGNANAKVLDASWSEVQLLETELIAKKLALQKKQADLIVDALKSQRG